MISGRILHLGDERTDVGKGTVLYVYYKLEAAQHVELVPRVRQFQQQLLQRMPGLSCELLQRPEVSAQGKETWMEIYRHVEGLDDDMMQQISSLAEEMALPQPRLAEVFVPLR